MNKSALKKFAIEARNILIEQVILRASIFGITENDIAPVYSEGDDSLVINGQVHNKKIKKQRSDLVKQINEKGFDLIIEEVAYTWFNRFMALRFMEVNDYLPTGTRVLSSIVADRDDPDLYVNCLKVDLPIDKDKVYTFQDKNDREGLYRYLLLIQCNELNSILPFMFEPIQDYTELLLPDNLLYSDSVIRKMVRDIPEEDWKEVEIIGWLYQYYISEKKDVLIKAKKAYESKNIPAVTQLFTPEWIVKYMVQNSLGRYWLEARPNKDLQSKWKFYLESRDEDSKKKLNELINPGMNPESIKVFDPAMGSAHILVCAFDVLFDIYQSCGYSERDIPELILTKNLYGLDIDTRATQLAKFALMMKARQKNRRILRKSIDLNLYEILDTKNFRDDEISVLAGDDTDINERLNSFVDCFREAKTLGSIIKVSDYDENFFNSCIKRGEQYASATTSTAPKKLKQIMGQARLLSRKYDICVANPPYMGNKYMNTTLKEYINKEYKNYKADLFTAFIKVLMARATEQGHLGVMSPFVWMFIQSYQKLREEIIRDKQITSLIQLEYSGFAEATVPICTYTIRNEFTDLKGEYIRLSDFPGAVNQPIKTLEAITNPDVDYRHTARSSDFSKIPGSPITYWVSDSVRRLFDGRTKIGGIGTPRIGLQTGDTNIFIRLWHEVCLTTVGFDIATREKAKQSKFKWFPLIKGGSFRKWHGNQTYLVNWQDDGFEIKMKKMKDLEKGKITANNSKCWNQNFYFNPSISWSLISSSNFSARCYENGFIFDIAGPSAFPKSNNKFNMLGILNSNLVVKLLKAICPTLNFTSGDISKLPFLKVSCVDIVIKKIMLLSNQDWDNFETSWDFKDFPLLRETIKSANIESSWYNYQQHYHDTTFEMQLLEEENNGIFIDAYGLQNELTPDVPLKEITLTGNTYYRYPDTKKREYTDQERENLFKTDTVKEFISYAVGCMMGRYSLDEEGLAYAGGEFDFDKYKTFPADSNAILPILDDDYFNDDIVSRFVEFVKVTFGEENISDNLGFISDAIGRTGNESSIERIRKYFLKDFYKDHCQRYKKRPIYWMFTSGNKKGFNCLIYLHRYHPGMIATIRTDYLHELQAKLVVAVNNLEHALEHGSKGEQVKARKRIAIIEKQQDELVKYDELMRHYADKAIDLDLDDGVKVNYEKFGDLLERGR